MKDSLKSKTESIIRTVLDNIEPLRTSNPQIWRNTICRWIDELNEMEFDSQLKEHVPAVMREMLSELAEWDLLEDIEDKLSEEENETKE